ncbi:hypothetical protein AAZX31_12G143400 [Glycine max]
MFQLSLIIFITIFNTINYSNGHMVPSNPINANLTNRVFHTKENHLFLLFHFSSLFLGLNFNPCQFCSLNTFEKFLLYLRGLVWDTTNKSFRAVLLHASRRHCS